MAITHWQALSKLPAFVLEMSPLEAAIIGESLAGYQREIRRKIELHEASTEVAKHHMVHACLADEALLTELFTRIQKAARESQRLADAQEGKAELFATVARQEAA